jgi:hypothetical protein
MPIAGNLSQEPRTPFRLINPDFQQARSSHVVVLRAKIVRVPIASESRSQAGTVDSSRHELIHVSASSFSFAGEFVEQS